MRGEPGVDAAVGAVATRDPGLQREDEELVDERQASDGRARANRGHAWGLGCGVGPARRAGTPTAICWAGMDARTTAPAPITAALADADAVKQRCAGAEIGIRADLERTPPRRNGRRKLAGPDVDVGHERGVRRDRDARPDGHRCRQVHEHRRPDEDVVANLQVGEIALRVLHPERRLDRHPLADAGPQPSQQRRTAARVAVGEGANAGVRAAQREQGIAERPRPGADPDECPQEEVSSGARAAGANPGLRQGDFHELRIGVGGGWLEKSKPHGDAARRATNWIDLYICISGCIDPQMRISIELVPRSPAALDASLATLRASFPAIDTVNIPDLVRFPFRSWHACARARQQVPNAIPHLRARDFAPMPWRA